MVQVSLEGEPRMQNLSGITVKLVDDAHDILWLNSRFGAEREERVIAEIDVSQVKGNRLFDYCLHINHSEGSEWYEGKFLGCCGTDTIDNIARELKGYKSWHGNSVQMYISIPRKFKGAA